MMVRRGLIVRVMGAFRICFFGLAFVSLMLGGILEAGVLEDAEKSYDAGHYDVALEGYSTWLENNPVNGDVLYNMGNAYYRSGQLGHSMGAYLAARSMRPRDPDIKANLKFVHGLIRDRLDVEREGELGSILYFWLPKLTVKELSYAVAWAWLVGCIFFVVFFLIGQKSSGLRAGGLGCWCLALLLAVWASVGSVYQDVWGAVVRSEVEAYSGPGLNSSVVFKLHEGAPVVVEQRQSGWVQVALSDNRRGWLEADAVYSVAH